MNYHIEKYKHFGDCICISNGNIDLRVPICFGIRIIYCALKGRDNIFYEQPKDADYLCAKSGWRLYGGHRIWLAPESDDTYYPDNNEIDFTIKKDTLRIDQQIDKFQNIKKSIEISFSPVDPDQVILRSIVKNMSNEDMTFGIWTISAMDSYAKLSIPFIGSNGGFSSNRNISLWGGTSLCDKRLEFNRNSINVNHEPNDDYFKIGLWCNKGEAKCISNNQVFEKHFDIFQDNKYPDNNVNMEVFQCSHMMEFELLGPLVKLKSGEEAEFSEIWSVYSSYDD